MTPFKRIITLKSCKCLRFYKSGIHRKISTKQDRFRSKRFSRMTNEDNSRRQLRGWIETRQPVCSVSQETQWRSLIYRRFARSVTDWNSIGQWKSVWPVIRDAFRKTHKLPPLDGKWLDVRLDCHGVLNPDETLSFGYNRARARSKANRHHC